MSEKEKKEKPKIDPEVMKEFMAARRSALNSLNDQLDKEKERRHEQQ